ncbi:hypothetical protein [Ethanoligenens sp.]|uniref:hypothetical protein n=1 Tax=Ethanoligenens sp. TaxID=2099655 RepID=UPI0039EB18B4
MLSKETLKNYAESECEEIIGVRDLNQLNNDQLINVVIRLIMKAADDQQNPAQITNIVRELINKENRYSDY